MDGFLSRFLHFEESWRFLSMHLYIWEFTVLEIPRKGAADMFAWLTATRDCIGGVQSWHCLESGGIYYYRTGFGGYSHLCYLGHASHSIALLVLQQLCYFSHFVGMSSSRITIFDSFEFAIHPSHEAQSRYSGKKNMRFEIQKQSNVQEIPLSHFKSSFVPP